MLGELPQLLANALILAASYTLLALGFATIFGTTKIFHFAHGSVYVAAAYLLYFFMVTEGWPLIPSIICGIVGGAILGGLINLFLYEPLIKRGSSRHVIFISSLGLFTVFDSLVSLPYGRSPLNVPSGMSTAVTQFGSAYVTRPQEVIVVVSAVLLIAVPLFFKFTRLGVAIRALQSDPTLANTLGVNIKLTRTVVFVLGSALAAVAAILSTLDVGSLDPSIDLNAILVATVAVIIGGIGSMTGATLAGVLLAVFTVLSQGYLSAQWTDAIVYIAVIVVIMFLPRGLMGQKLSRLGK